MNPVIVPPSPNWYEDKIIACAPDNTVIYGSRTDLVILEENADPVKAASVRIIPKAHAQRVLCVSINKNWSPSKKLLVSADDKIVKLWNVETGKKVECHDKHVTDSRIAGVTFAGDDRVISVSDDGHIVIWNILNKETKSHRDLFEMKVGVTCISTCPHANWLTAFGLKSGLVVVMDLRKDGKLLHRMRGHDKPIISLTWCPAPINIFPQSPRNYVVQKKKEQPELEAAVEKEATTQELVPAVTAHPLLKVYDDSGDEDFLKECQILKNKIAGSHENITDKFESEEAEGSPNQLHHIIDKNILEQSVDSSPQKLEETVDSQSTDSKQKLDDQSNKTGKQEEGKRSELDEADEPTTCESPLNIDDLEIIEMDEMVKSPEDLECPKLIASELHIENEDSIVTNTDNLESMELNESKSPIPIEEDIVKNEKNLESSKLSASEIHNENEDGSANKSEDPESSKPKCDKDDNETKNEDNVANKSEDLESSKSKCDKDETETTDEDSITKKSEDPEGSKPKCDKDDTETKNEDNVANKSGDPESSKPKCDKEATETKDDAERNIVTITSKGEDPRKEFLLASSARDSHIYIWRAGTDGRMQAFVGLPFKNNRFKAKGQLEKLWISLCWITPTVLLSSSKQFELLAWTLPQPREEAKRVKIIQKEHSTLLFSIAAPQLLLNEYNWRDGPMATNVWTTAQDRLLINANLKDGAILANYATFGGHVSQIQVSPLDPHRLGLGTSDGYIKILDLSRPHVKILNMTPFYSRILSKVSCLAWHPTNECILAFGTFEGRVGYIDPTNRSSPTTLAKPYFKSQIHSMQWAPIRGDKKKFGLYIISEGQMALFDPMANYQELIPLLKNDHTYLYSLSWTPDYSMLLVVAKTGHVIVYTPNLKVICKHYFSFRLLEIVWHPNAVDYVDESSADVPPNKYKNWFAAIANFHTVVVYKFDVESGNNDDNIVNFYRGEAELITSIAWNPFVPSQLIISFDIGIIQVWDVEMGVIVSTIENANFDTVTAAIISPINPDYLISGGKDNTVRIWKTAEHPPKDEKGIIYKRKKMWKIMGKESTHLLPKEEPEEETPIKSPKDSRNYLLPKFYGGKEMKAIKDLRKLLKWKENQETEGPDEIRKINDVLNIFGTDEAMIKLVQENESSHQKRGKLNFSTTLSLFRGDLSTTIKEAIDTRRVTPRIIELAPMVSPKLWQAACEAYAGQLAEAQGSDPLEAATFYLTCHKVHEALAVLCEGHLFREALALAKCRMMGKEVIDNVIEKWANSMKNDGNFEIAAQCYIYLGRYEDAASILYRRTDLHVLEFLLELIEKIDNEELKQAVIYRYNSFKQAEAETTDQESTEPADFPTRVDILLQKQADSEKNITEHQREGEAGTVLQKESEQSATDPNSEHSGGKEAGKDVQKQIEEESQSENEAGAGIQDHSNITQGNKKKETIKDSPASLEMKPSENKLEDIKEQTTESKIPDNLKPDKDTDVNSIKVSETSDVTKEKDNQKLPVSESPSGVPEIE